MHAEPIIESGKPEGSDQELKETRAAPPLVVDLDGTLIKSDLLFESVLSLVRQQPWHVALLPFWLGRGKAFFKHEVVRHSSLDVATLPWRDGVIGYLRQQRNEGRRIVLATGSDGRTARRVADHLKLFDEVLATDGAVNLTGKAKRDLLVSRFGESGFDYVADGAQSDLAVWAAARRAVLVNPTANIRAAAPGGVPIDRVFDDPARTAADWLRPLRPAHWFKNLLVFVPLLAAHHVGDAGLLKKAVLAFVAFGCSASGGYLFNDLMDLEADRHHPHKRARPFASGQLPLTYGLAMVPVLLVAGALLAASVSLPLEAMLIGYFALSIIYSVRIKHVAILDVLFLAGLYTVRMMAGAVAVRLPVSQWLLAFSTFLFFSLALVKRYSELMVMRSLDRNSARSYELSDAELLAAMGAASGYLAVLVLALYIASDKALALYTRPAILWCICPLLLYWISHVWLVAHRGKMHDDPLVFALGNRTSAILIALMLAAAVAAL